MIVMKKIKKTVKDMDKGLFLATTLLFVFGLLNIVTASSKAAVIRYSMSLYSYFFKQLAAIIVGVIASIFIINKPTKKYPKYIAFLYFAILGLLLYLLFYGKAHNGSKNWIPLWKFTLQPSEFAKPIMIIGVSILYEKFYKKLRSPALEDKTKYNMIGIICFVGCIFSGIVFLQKDLGTFLIMAAIFGCLFITSPIPNHLKIRTICAVIFVVVIMGIVYINKNGGLFTASQSSRFDFFDPCSDYYDGGYQICNGFIAINDGGLIGLGIGNSKQVSYIPESHTDSVFAIIAEEYGLVGCSIIFLTYLFILFRILKLSSRTSSVMGRYTCFGIAIYIFLHILINLGGLFGIMPLTGVPLPFLSYGGSFTLALMCSLAVVQRIHIETENERIKINN